MGSLWLPLFLFENIAIAWPDQLDSVELVPSTNLTPQQIATAIRLNNDPVRVEAALLTRVNIKENNSHHCQQLLCWLYFNQFERNRFVEVLNTLRQQDVNSLETRILTLVGWLWANDLRAVSSAPANIWRGEGESELLKLCRASFYIKTGDLKSAQSCLNSLSAIGIASLEANLLQAQIYHKQANYHDAITFLLPLHRRAPKCLRLYRQLLSHMIDGKDATNILKCAKSVLFEFGEHHEILYHITTINLYQRHPGLARRSALLQQASASIRPTLINLGNQIATYEMNGQACWAEHLLAFVQNNALVGEDESQANLIMQFASIQSTNYQPVLENLVGSLEALPSYASLYKNDYSLLSKHRSHENKNQSLRIAWVTGDCAYHPVSRFLYSFFCASSQKNLHSHTLISLRDNGTDSMASEFLNNANIDLVDISAFGVSERIQSIRDNNYDIAIDLSGWTGGNFVAGFHSRLAPVQVNYLGYFASMGLPTMDYWLGDNAIFPQCHSEWATETLWRLPRPFLAWQPFEPLPEASIDVGDPPSGPLRFGSFNHNRKLSDATLRLWAGVLNAVPGSRLTLKAAADADADTQRLLRRRMIRNGIDPERIDWLALTKGPREHMQQYARIDIALDPIPNGGCTTTCEALWLGVPTITMAGSHYVSRMSTAVLSGAGMDEWIAADAAAYIALAQLHAETFKELRANRQQWRKRLQASPLGDAADLMFHLEQAFSAMHTEKLSSF